MERDLSRLVATKFDVLVIGAGIYGATIAWDAAQRGLSVAVIDRGDFGGGTSFNNHKTVHGGLRSLQQGNFPQMREFIRERRALSRILPHLIHPLPFLVPTYRRPTRSRTALRLALAVHNLVSRDRNDLPDTSKHLPAGRVISRQECLQRYPALDPAGVTGGALWYDCQMYNTDRVTLAFLLSSAGAGAVAANYVEATGFLRSGDRLLGVRARDRIDNQDLDIEARLVVNAAGPWAGSVLKLVPGADSAAATMRLSKAMNLVLERRIATDHALGGLVGSRFLFLLPWRDVNVIGTSHEPFVGNPDALSATGEWVDGFLKDARQAFPTAALTRDDIRLVHRGLLPMVNGNGSHVRLLKESLVHDHRREGVQGLLTVMGVRFTTARHTARSAVDAVFRFFGREPPPCRTDVLPLAGGDIRQFDEFLRVALAPEYPGVSRDTVRRLVLSYGSNYRRVLALMLNDLEHARPIGNACGVTRAEIRYAVREEMAVKLSDAMLRRTEAGSAGHPGPDAFREAAAVMGEELGWDRDRMMSEIAEVEATYRID
jgi:glycerol-3-phosphate dehydrogenase